MKILFLTNKPPYPLKDGGAIASYRLIEGMSKARHQVHLLSMNTLKHKVSMDSLPAGFKTKINTTLVDIPAPISAKGAIKNLLFSKLPYNAERFKSSEFEDALVDLLSQHQFDAIQLEGLYLSFYIDTIRKHSKAKIIYRAHNVEHEIWQRSLLNEKNPVKKKYLKLLTKRLKRFELSVLNRYDLIMPITPKDAGYFTKAGSKRPLLVTPTGFDCSKIDGLECCSENNTVLFHLGALDWFPNQEGLIWFLENVWEYILKQHPKLKFSIAGRNAPQWFIDKLNSFPNIIYEGEVPDAVEYYKDKQIMIVPLLSGSGMRIKIVEGMALGKSIVTTNIGAEGLAVEHQKQLMLSDTPEEYAASVHALINDTYLRKQLSVNAVKFIREELDNEKIIQNVSAFIQKNLN